MYFSGDKNNMKVVANYKHCETVKARWRRSRVGRSQWRWQSRKRKCSGGRWAEDLLPRGPVDEHDVDADDDGENDEDEDEDEDQEED